MGSSCGTNTGFVLQGSVRIDAVRGVRETRYISYVALKPATQVHGDIGRIVSEDRQR